VEKKPKKSHVLQNIDTGEYMNLDVNDSNPNYKKFYIH
jgi:hypothetical protein